MKILFFFTYNRSFLSNFFVELCESLVNTNNSVKVYSLKKAERCIELDSGLEITILKKRNKILNYFNLFKIIKIERPDVVVSNFSYVNPVVLSSYILGIQHNVIWFHTLKEQMGFSRLKIFIKSKFMNLASAIITNSIELRNEVSKDYGQSENNLYSLPFTTSVCKVEKSEIDFSRELGKVYIGCPGRINRDKNQKLLLDILPILNNPQYIIVFAGSKEEDVIENHFNYQRYKNQIIYLNTLKREEMISFYNEMDVIVLPSGHEAFGLVLIEALAIGKTTLVSKNFGALDYIEDNISNIIFNPENPEELAQKLYHCLAIRKEAEYFKNLYSSNFSLNRVVKDFESIIQ